MWCPPLEAAPDNQQCCLPQRFVNLFRCLGDALGTSSHAAGDEKISIQLVCISEVAPRGASQKMRDLWLT